MMVILGRIHHWNPHGQPQGGIGGRHCRHIASWECSGMMRHKMSAVERDSKHPSGFFFSLFNMSYYFRLLCTDLWGLLQVS